MSSPFMRWLLDLQTIPPEAGELRLGWERGMPGWAWFLAIVTVAGLVMWSYARIRGPRPVRVGLAVIRGALLLLLLALLCGPALVMPRERVEQDWVLMLVDRSASMQVEDVRAADGRRQSRDAQLRDSLRRGEPVLRELAERRTMVWLGFDGSAFELPTAAPDAANSGTSSGAASEVLERLGSPEGWRTRLATSIEEALQRAAARPLAGVVLFTDGRTTDPPNRALIRRLQLDDARIYAVPLGSDAALGDLALRRATAPQRAFVRDFVPVTVEVERIGRGAAEQPATLRLVDAKSGAELDRLEVPTGVESATLTLTGRRDDAGDANWTVVLDAPRDDLVPENNRRELVVGLVDRPLRVLYVEGYPRWEYRYLKNLLVRESSVESSVMLLSADRDFAQEGNLPLARLPRVAEEFAPFDLFIIGDVPASVFSPEQLELIRSAVAERGAGLLWIGGPQSTPSEWAGTALTDLLPMRPPLELPPIGVPVTMVATPLADRLGVLQLRMGDSEPSSLGAWPRELADPATGWSRLQWAQRIDPTQLKPTSEILAETAQVVGGAPSSLVVAMRYGAGQVLYVASDEIWRWRFGRGELLPEQFWLQMVRMLGRERVTGGDAAVALEALPRRVDVGKPVRVSLRLLDEALAGLDLGSVAAVIERVDDPDRADGSTGPAAVEALGEIELRSTGRTGEFAAIWVADREGGEAVGMRRVRIVDPTLPEAAGAEAIFEVVRPDEERRRPEADHALLATLAAESGGKVLPPDDLSELRTMPRREIRTEDPITERIWNTPLALLLVVLLATLEWIGRRLINLL